MRDDEQSLASLAVPTRAAELIAAQAEVAASPFNLKANLLVGRCVITLAFIAIFGGALGFLKAIWLDYPIGDQLLNHCSETAVVIVATLVLAALPFYLLGILKKMKSAYRDRGLI